MSTTAISALHSAFTDSFSALGRDPGHDRNVVVTAWPSVPVEVIRAAGLTPVLVRGDATATPEADRVLEEGVFPSRIRQLLQAALAGRLNHVAAVVLPRTSEADYKAFLYLLELRRRGQLGALPPVLLFDLLQSPGPETTAYDSARVRDLFTGLCAISGSEVSTDQLRTHIVRSNEARAAARRLAALRRDPARVAGAEVLPLLGAFWYLPAERYVALADEALDELARRAPLGGARVLLAGAPVDTTDVHRAIESLHGLVVDEISPCGSDGMAADIDAATDPFVALARSYSTNSITARAPVAKLVRRVRESLDGIDAAFIVLPADDARFGWDVPRLRQLLQARGIAHGVISGKPAADRERIRAVLDQATQVQAVRHG